MSTVEELSALIVKQAEEIRQLKEKKVDKETLQPAIQALLDFKERFKVANGGVSYDPPKAEAPKKDKAKAPQPDVPVKEGPSKKELNKLARKEKQASYKSGAGETTESKSSDAAIEVSKPEPAKVDKKASVKSDPPKYQAAGVYFSQDFPAADVARITAGILGVDLAFYPSHEPTKHIPFYTSPSSKSSSISGDCNIARYLCRSTLTKGKALYGEDDAWLASEVDNWLDVFTSHLSITDEVLVANLPPLLNSHFADKTFAVGQSLTLADIALYVSVKRIKFKPSSDFTNVTRWLNLVESQLPTVIGASKGGGKGKGVADSTAKVKVAGGGSSDAAGKSAGADTAMDDGGACPPLEDAVEGAVCTRFPPEPSGYLHIGHAKAVLLNQYYAQRYKGRLLVRFDDTNPSKEKEEFADNIIQDLATLGVKGDSVSHTSDHFAKCEELARKMIKEGNAYMDDTDQAKMQAERMERVESVRRGTSVEENLAMFEKLLKGEPEARVYCLRAKIDMNSVNGTMRDPVMYRYNDTPHHRTGTKFKAYPTYDLACPIVDSVEGVTHALRTTEYNDRDEQYYWIQNALGLRPVKIMAFGKMNFVHTVLSKRKLNWFVENNHVEGWFDPRFPTIQGCVRRGMNVEALKNFILGQGASRRVITMEWDKFWAENKRVLEDTAPRFMGVAVDDVVELTVTNVPDEIVAVSVQIHPQKPEMGNRVMRRFNKVYVDQADAATYKEGEEVTFLRWGNFFIDKIVKDEASGKVLSMEGRAHPEATNFSKTKKVTWLANTPDNVTCTLVELDHLIAKAKLDEEENFHDFINPNTWQESTAICDPCLRSVQRGDVIQLERKGFYRVDVPYSNPAKPLVLFAIPDGKVKPAGICHVKKCCSWAASAAPAGKGASGGKKK